MTQPQPSLPGSDAKALMQLLATWDNTTTIVLHGGCVFEFKGPFPAGKEGEGYFNLDGPVPGFHFGSVALGKAINAKRFFRRPYHAPPVAGHGP